MGFRISFERVPKGFRLRNSFKDGNDYERYGDLFECCIEMIEVLKLNIM